MLVKGNKMRPHEVCSWNWTRGATSVVKGVTVLLEGPPQVEKWVEKMITKMQKDKCNAQSDSLQQYMVGEWENMIKWRKRKEKNNHARPNGG